MKSVRWIMSYILVATLGLWLAFAVSMKVMTPARSQDAPGSGDLPAEFLKEIESAQVPGGDAANEEGSAQVPKKQDGNAAAAEEAQPAPPLPMAEEVPPPQPMVETGRDSSTVDDYGDGATAAQVPTRDSFSDGYFYDPSGKRDPFIPFKVIRPQMADTGAMEVLEPLQRWELERLQVVGILWEVKTPRAMIRDPDGVVFTITKNSKIGRNEGFVAAIREGEVVILETRYEEGKAIKEPRIMEFRK